MALFAIAATHLSLGEDKKMDKFFGWENYEQRIRDNWLAIVKPADTVVLAGDISWAMRLSETLADFNYLHELPGRKILMKGNHDYWWSTKKKMDNWLAQNGFAAHAAGHTIAPRTNKRCFCAKWGGLKPQSMPGCKRERNRSFSCIILLSTETMCAVK